MFKKSLAYKIFWDEELQDIYEKLINLLKAIKKDKKFDLEKIYNERNLEKFWFKGLRDLERLIKLSKKNAITAVVWQKLWLWDKSICFAEDWRPLWWLLLQVIN